MFNLSAIIHFYCVYVNSRLYQNPPQYQRSGSNYCRLRILSNFDNYDDFYWSENINIIIGIIARYDSYQLTHLYLSCWLWIPEKQVTLAFYELWERRDVVFGRRRGVGSSGWRAEDGEAKLSKRLRREEERDGEKGKNWGVWVR